MRQETTKKPKIIVLFSDCNHSRALGDFAQCAQIGYELERATGIQTTLLTRANSAFRFDTLYKIENQNTHAIYGTPISITTIEQFNSDNYEICGYIEVSCKPNDKGKVEEYIREKNCKAVLIGTANTTSDYPISCKMRLGYDQFIQTQKINVLMAGFGEHSRSGITYTPYSVIKRNTPENELKLPPLVEKIISQQKDLYGLIFTQQTSNQNADKCYALGYLKHFFKYFGTTLIAIGSHSTIFDSAIQFCLENKTNIRLKDSSTNRVIFIDQNGKQIMVDNNNSSASQFQKPIQSKSLNFQFTKTIVLCNPISNIKMRRLLNNSAKFVGLSGASSFLEALGEGKLIYAQFVPTNITFINNYMSEVISMLRHNPQICDFAKLLFAKKPLFKFQEDRLSNQLNNIEFCDELQECHKKIIAKYAGKLTNNIINKLGIFAFTEETDSDPENLMSQSTINETSVISKSLNNMQIT